MAETKPLLSGEMMKQIEETARVEKENWLRFVERNERKARALGITEDDVPRLVEEARREGQRHLG